MKVISEEGNNLFRCKHCDTELKSTATWTSTPMANHLRRIHQITKETVPAATTTGSQTPVKAGESVTKFPPGDMRHALLHRSSKDKAGNLNELAILVVTDLCPLSIVDGKGFRAHQSHMSGGTVESVSRTAVSRHIMAKATRAREMLKKRTQDLNLRSVHCTTDGWADRQQNGYFSFTLQGTSDDFVLHNLPGDVTLVTGRHTGEHLHKFLKKKLEEFGVDMCTLTTDSASNQLKAGRLCVEDGILKERLSCSTHTLNLIVRKVLPSRSKADQDEPEDVEKELSEESYNERADEIGSDSSDDDDDDRLSADEMEEFLHVARLVRRVRRLSAIFRRSNVLAEALKSAQIELREKKRYDVKFNLRPIVDCPTRWSSTYLMLDRIMTLKAPIAYVKATHDVPKKQARRFLEEVDWQLAEEIREVLKPFHAATKILSGEKYVTASRVLTVWLKLSKTITKLSEDKEFTASRAACKVLNKELKAHWDKLLDSKSWLTSTVCDPNYKKLKIVRKESRPEIYQWMKDMMTEIKLEDAMRASERQSTKAFDDAAALSDLSESEDSNEDDIAAELERYKSQPVAVGKVDPLR